MIRIVSKACRMIVAASLLALAILHLAVTRPAAREGLTFGLVGKENSQSMLDDWQPVASSLSRTLGEPVMVRTYDDYAGVVWAMGAGKIQLAWLGNKSAIEAVDRSGGEVLVKSVNVLDGADGYRALLIAPADSPLATEQDMFERAAGLTFGNGDPNSTSGSVVPDYYLFAARGLEPRRIFKRVTTGNHESNFLAVAEGRADVATCNSTDLKRLGERYPGLAPRVKVIWTSPLIPSDPIVVRRDLPPKLKARIAQFFTGYGKGGPGKTEAQTAEEAACLQRLSWMGFVASDDSQLESIRAIELFNRRRAISGDPSLDAAEKERILKEIEGKRHPGKKAGAQR